MRTLVIQIMVTDIFNRTDDYRLNINFINTKICISTHLATREKDVLRSRITETAEDPHDASKWKECHVGDETHLFI